MVYYPPEDNPELSSEISYILAIVKARLNRGQRFEPEMDDYLSVRIHAAILELNRNGIHYRYEDPSDRMFVTDYVCWQYSNRDKKEPMPEWLRLARRERWLTDDGKTETEDNT